MDLSLAIAAGALSSAATLMVVGLLVVFTTLVVLALVIVGLGRLGRVGEERAVNAPAPDSEAEPSGGGDRRHLVVISAAVAAAAGPRSRVHRIVVLGREAGRQWVSEGRVEVMGSHRPRR